MNVAPISQPRVMYPSMPLSARPKKISKKRIAFYILLTLVGMVLLVQYLNAARYEMLVQVKDIKTVGVNPTGEKLDFGDLPRDKDAIRVVNLANNSPYNISSYVMVLKYGGISDFVKVDKNNFTLSPGQETKLEFTLHVPSSAEYKYYTGKTLIFQIPKFW